MKESFTDPPRPIRLCYVKLLGAPRKYAQSINIKVCKFFSVHPVCLNFCMRLYVWGIKNMLHTKNNIMKNSLYQKRAPFTFMALDHDWPDFLI